MPDGRRVRSPLSCRHAFQAHASLGLLVIVSQVTVKNRLLAAWRCAPDDYWTDMQRILPVDSRGAIMIGILARWRASQERQASEPRRVGPLLGIKAASVIRLRWDMCLWRTGFVRPWRRQLVSSCAGGSGFWLIDKDPSTGSTYPLGASITARVGVWALAARPACPLHVSRETTPTAEGWQ